MLVRIVPVAIIIVAIVAAIIIVHTAKMIPAYRGELNSLTVQANAVAPSPSPSFAARPIMPTMAVRIQIGAAKIYPIIQPLRLAASTG